MMFQDYALFPHLTVLDNVGFALKIGGMSKTERHSVALDYLKKFSLMAFQIGFLPNSQADSNNGLRLPEHW